MIGAAEELGFAEVALTTALEAVRRARAALQAAPGAQSGLDAPLTVEEAAAAHRVRPATIRERIRSGALVARKAPGSKRWLISAALLAHDSAPAARPVADLEAHRRTSRAAELAAAALKGG